MWFSTVTIVSILQSAEKQLQYINGYNVAFQLLFLMLLRENELYRSFYTYMLSRQTAECSFSLLIRKV